MEAGGYGQLSLGGSDLWRDPRREAGRQVMPQLAGLQERPVAALGLLRHFCALGNPSLGHGQRATALESGWEGPRVWHLQTKARPSPTDRLSPPKST